MNPNTLSSSCWCAVFVPLIITADVNEWTSAAVFDSEGECLQCIFAVADRNPLQRPDTPPCSSSMNRASEMSSVFRSVSFLYSQMNKKCPGSTHFSSAGQNHPESTKKQEDKQREAIWGRSSNWSQAPALMAKIKSKCRRLESQPKLLPGPRPVNNRKMSIRTRT